MRDDFDALIADRFAVLVDMPVPDTWSRVQSKLLDPTAAPFTEEEPTMIELEAPTRTGEHRYGRPLIGALVGVAAVATLIGALVVVARRDDADRLPPVDSIPVSVPVTTVPAPMTTASVPVDSSPDTLPGTTADTLPATTIDTTPATATDTTPVTEFLDVPADQIAVVREFVEAINAGDADAFLGVLDPEGGFDPRGGFAKEELELFPQIQHSDEEPLVRAWMSILDAWGLEVGLSCRPRVGADDNLPSPLQIVDGEDGFLLCDVRLLWHRLSLELAEEWQLNLRGQKVTWFGKWSSNPLVDLNPEPRRLPLGYDGLEAWEAWLERTNPEATALYLNPRGIQGCDADCVADLSPDDPELALRMSNLWEFAENDWVIDGHRFRPRSVIPYDPQWADEIEASIQDYLDTDRNPGS